MKNLKHILIVLLIAFLKTSDGQSSFHLNQLHQIKIKNIAQGATPETYLNENGWVFVRLGGGGGDSINIQDFSTDSSKRGSVLIAFDNQMRLRWTFVYRQGTNTSIGSMGILGTGPNNSVFFTCGARDSLILPGIEPLYLSSTSNIYRGIIDSTGVFKNLTKFEGVYTSSFGAYPVANGKIVVRSTSFPFILNPDLTVEATGNVSGAISAVIQPDGTAYYLNVSNMGGSRTILDTLIEGEMGVHKWILTKVKNGQREWTHVINNNRDVELNENKLVRYDKNGNVYFAIQHRQEISVAGTTIPYYTNGNTTSVTKACILRFAPDGTLLSTHHDTSSTVPFAQNRQTIWLENDKEMNVYAYLFTSGRTYNFDKINMGEEYSRKHRILTFNHTTNTFDRSWYVISPLTDGSIAMSFLANRQVFWHSFNLNTNTFHEGTTLTRVWNDDRVIAVYDTLPATGSVTSVQTMNKITVPFINVYPNPSNEKFTIQNNFQGEISCNVYSVEGRKVGEFRISEGDKYDLVNLPQPGIYFVESINQMGERFTVRIIKQ